MLNTLDHLRFLVVSISYSLPKTMSRGVGSSSLYYRYGAVLEATSYITIITIVGPGRRIINGSYWGEGHAKSLNFLVNSLSAKVDGPDLLAAFANAAVI